MSADSVVSLRSYFLRNWLPWLANILLQPRSFSKMVWGEWSRQWGQRSPAERSFWNFCGASSDQLLAQLHTHCASNSSLLAQDYCTTCGGCGYIPPQIVQQSWLQAKVWGQLKIAEEAVRRCGYIVCRTCSLHILHTTEPHLLRTHWCLGSSLRFFQRQSRGRGQGSDSASLLQKGPSGIFVGQAVTSYWHSCCKSPVTLQQLCQ